jgi:hypothetical protein
MENMKREIKKMTTVDQKGTQRVFKRIVTGNVKRILHGDYTVADAVEDIRFRFDLAGAVTIAEKIFEEAAQIDKQHPEKFYCGRCMRFFPPEGFSESNQEKARNGEGGYCLDDSKMKIDTNVDFETGTVTIVPINTKPAQQKEKKKEAPVTRVWDEDPTIENLVASIKRHYENKAVKLTYVEVVFKNEYSSRLVSFLQSISEHWAQISTQEHTILSSILLRPLDSDEMSVINEFAVSVAQKEKTQKMRGA